MSLPNPGCVGPQAPTLPLEIVEEIATHVSGKDTFKAASTVSQAWLSAFRPKLFAHIVLGKRFMAAIASPIFADDKRLLPFITSVKVQGILTALVNEKLLVALNMLPKLESLELSGVGLGWDQTTPQLTELLVQLLQKESLQRLSVEFSADRYSGFPLALVPYCRQIRTLSLEDTTQLFPLFIENDELFFALTRNLESLSCSQPSPVALQTLKLSGTGLISRFARFHSRRQGWLSPNSLERLELEAFGSSVKMLSFSVCGPDETQDIPPLNEVHFANITQVHTLRLTLTAVFGEAGRDLLSFVRTWACQILRALSTKDSITQIAITCQMTNCQYMTSDDFTSLNLVYRALDFALGLHAVFGGLKKCKIVFKKVGRVAIRTIPTGTPDNQLRTGEESLEDEFPFIQERRIDFYAALVPEDLQNSDG
ncbi:hypothetical protein NP233_g11616 [Leucocoprinus birnbaumii]|uniref:F-box domain-containing protein n=1 Tax=Leucocoprinus birnbaumii TaxID=56174 RepID=A0AAD5VG73_9AGAR|nr:hypothetical protein NP233_g11616 [Leucocoprinus birnbaumii]